MATRSPSPNPSRPTNTNPKTPDSSNSLRKSSSNLSKLSISSEFPQRNSGSKASATLPSLRASFEQKENEKDPNCSKPSKAKSPAMSSSKGSKNFMAPTISASSKVIAASPRKKILAERNEVTPDAVKITTVSAEGVGMDEIRPKPEMGFGSQEILGGIGSGKVDPKIKNDQYVAVPSFSPSPVIASLDAYPSLPPYDPKTNYLSPRPRFLHYKPNPRIEQYLNNGGNFLEVGDGKRLEDSFSSESGEDTAVLTEEAQSSYLQKDSEEESSPDSTEVEEEELRDETHVAKPELKSKPSGSHFKYWSFTRSKLVPLLLVLTIACLYAPLSDSPIISSSMLNDHSFSKLYNPSLGVFEDLHLRGYLGVAHVNLKGLANRFRHWSIDSIAYFTSLAPLQREEFGLFHLANLTSPAVDETVDSDFTYSVETGSESANEENRVAEGLKYGTEYEAERMEMEVLEEVKEEQTEYETENIEMEVSEDVKEDDTENGFEKIGIEVSEDVKEDHTEQGDEKIEIEVSEDVHPVEYEMEMKIEEDGREELDQENSHPDNEALHIEEEVGKDLVVESGMENQEVTSILDSLTEIQPAGFGESHSESGEEYQTSHSPKISDFMNYGAEEKLLVHAVLGISLAVTVLAATFVFFHMKKKQTPMASQEKILPPKKLGSVSGSSETYTPAKGTPSQNIPGSVEMVGDSGPSEVSSSLNDSSSFGRPRTMRGKEEETLSHERRMRRDSAASSISYGSFTTYELLSAKKGCGDEEVVTPVRRSSRIRNQVTSP